MRPRRQIALVLAPVVIVMGINALVRRQAAPGDFGAAPDFALTERGGQAVTRADLRGKVWVANFIFTRCGGPCPLLSEKMAGLQKRLADPDLRLVSFSVDPAYDTPEVLKAYAGRYGADPHRWWFLTGETEPVYAVIRDGFHLAVAPDPSGKEGEQVVHNLSFVLVDRQGRIRGYYGGTDETELEKLRRDARKLL